nr:WG repeat-containing protein [uncultured Fluviicola sp.]
MDRHGQIKIEAKFDAAEQFTEGFAVVYLNGKAGVINQSNELVVKPIYDNIKQYVDGFAVVTIQDKYGLIDTTGKIVLKPKYDWIGFQADNIIGLKEDELWTFYSLIERKKINRQKYKSIGAFSEGLASVEDNYSGKHGFINSHGDLIIPFVLTLVYSDFSNGFAAVCDSNRKNIYINKKGVNTLGKTFDSVDRFYEERAFVKDTYYSEGYFIDTTGNRISQNTYKSAWFYREGLCGVKKDNNFLVIDKNEKVLFSSTTIEIRFTNGEFVYFCDHSKDDLTWGIMNKQFKQVTDLRFTQFLNDRSVSRLECYYGDPTKWYGYGKHGYLNIEGTVIWEEKTMDNTK